MERPFKRVWFEDHSFPKCFESRKQFKDWRQAMEQAKVPLYTCWVCTDCLPTYQKKMIKAGRCENPHVKFKKEYENRPFGQSEEDYFIVGYVDDETYKKELERKKHEARIFWAKYARY